MVVWLISWAHSGLFRGFAINTLGHFPGQFLYYSAYEYSNQRLRSLIPDNIGPNSSRALGILQVID